MIDRFVQAAIEIDKRVARPELFFKFIPRYYFAWVRQQKQEDLERLVPEFDPHTLLAQFARVEVDFEYTKMDRAAIFQHTHAS
ncbi:MAG: hypothetical protein ACR2I2_08000 [Bryobacteraceae bacterium]